MRRPPSFAKTHLDPRRRNLLRAITAAPASLLLASCGGGSSDPENRYVQSNLAANSARYGARFTFPTMVNAWGIAIRPRGAGGHFWVTGGGTSWQFVGDVTQSPTPQLRTLFQDGLSEVALPGADSLGDDASIGKATGTVFNGAELNSDRFRVRGQAVTINGVTETLDGSARFIFASDTGVISGWTERRASDGAIVRANGPAVQVFDGGPAGIASFGLAIDPRGWDRLWIADFGSSPQIRTLDHAWNLVATAGFANPFATGPLIEPAKPEAGRLPTIGDPVPFNIHVLGTRVFVAYAISQPDPDNPQAFYAGEEDALSAEDETASGDRPGKGRFAEFDLDGRLVRAYDDDGRLNAPWGFAIAPANFGRFGNAVLVGNFGGHGRIAGYSGLDGRFIDYLRDEHDAIVGIEGLWGLQFGNGESLGDADALYFAAGPADEVDGLFGSLRYAG